MFGRASYYLVAALVLFGGAMRAETLSPYHVKAACLYNFLKFVEWPTASLAPDKPYVVGVLGRDPFGTILDATMKGKKVNGRPIEVVRVTERDMRQAHLLFISASERKRQQSIFAALQGAPVLTVGETDDFAEAGGMVEFFVERNKIRFQMNPGMAKRSDLEIDSTLLDLARIIPTPR